MHHLNCTMLGYGGVRHGYLDNSYSLLHKLNHYFDYLNMLIDITRCQGNLVQFIFLFRFNIIKRFICTNTNTIEDILHFVHSILGRRSDNVVNNDNGIIFTN